MAKKIRLEPLSTRLLPSDLEQLEALAKADNITPYALGRRAIEQFLSTYQNKKAA